MALARIAILLLPIVVVAAIVVLVVRLLRPERRMTLTVGGNEHVGVVTMARHTRLYRILGALVGLGVAVALASAGDVALGRLMLLTPMALGAGALLGVIVGEWTARPPRGSARTASLRRRSLGDLLPITTRWQMGIGLASAVSVLALGTALGGADDQGRAGRVLTRTCTAVMDGEEVLMSGSRGPWPGSYYTIPAALALLVVLGLAALATWTIIARQRPSAEDAALDDQLRRWSVMSVASATNVTLRLTAAPLAITMALLLAQNQRFDNCRYAYDQPLMYALFGLGLFCLITGFAALIEIFVGPRVIVDERPRPTPQADAGVPVR